MSYGSLDTSSLNNTKQFSKSPKMKRSSNLYFTNELNNSSNIRGRLSAEIMKNNVLETTSESEQEMGIKKKKAPLMLLDRRSTQNHFENILNLKQHKSLHEAADMSHASKNLSSNKISPQKLQEKEKLQIEDSEDSMSNIVPLKSRPRLLRKMSEKGNNEISKRLIDIMNKSEHNVGTLNEFGLEKSGERYTDSLNLSSRSSVKVQRSNVERHVMSDSIISEDNQDLFRKKRRTLQSRVTQRMQEKKNSFETVFADSSDVSLSRDKDMIQKVNTQFMTRDIEHRIPSSLHSEILVDDISDDNVSASRIPADVGIDNSLEIIKKSDRSASIKRASGQNFHKEAYLTRNTKSVTPESAADISANLLRRSMRLNNSTNNLILEPEVNMSNARQMSSKMYNRTMKDFFKVRHSSPDKKQATSNNSTTVPSKAFEDAKKMQQIKERVDIIKSRELAEMKMHFGKIDKKQLALDVKTSNIASRETVQKKKLLASSAKKVDPAYLVNGKVYRAPKLLRPKQWATDRLYNFLWKCMEAKYGLLTRVRSEKFILELSKVTTLIIRRNKYNNYKTELKVLMKEMARLKIINTRNDFYNFCRDFMPYEFRVKVIPILLPGNQRTIPYDPDKLHTPLLDE